MFSDLMKKMDEMPYKTLLGVAACLVILCQLVAMALVVDGQVKRAEARDSAQDSRRMVLARCNEAGSAAARQGCLQQALAAVSLPDNLEASGQVQALANSGSFERSDASTDKVLGFMPALYTTR